MNTIVSKFKEVLFSVLPIALIVLIIHFTVVPIEGILIVRFLVGSVFVVLGLTIFLIGVDIGITPLGSLTGVFFAKSNKLWVILTGGVILGFFISIAEPGLLVLANQVDTVTGGEISSLTILVVVSIGLAVLLAGGFARVFFNVPLNKVLLAVYLVILVLAKFTSSEFLAIAFDASGATTGVLAVPFILALALGISSLKKDSKAAEEDSFGLLAMASAGAIIGVMVLDILSQTREFQATLDISLSQATSLFSPFYENSLAYLWESVISIAPLMVILLVLQGVAFKLKRKKLRQLITGVLLAFVGLFVFLTGINAGFMDVATTLGNDLALFENKTYIVVIGFVLGVVTILAEPAVYILTRQIEDVTSGYVKRKAVLVALALGVGLSVALSMIRILTPSLQLWHYLLPGYIIAFAMSFFVPSLFVGIAFDAGGVATGPMTATFILAFVQGAANAFEGADLMVDGFGMIAMVAMTPIITLQALGFLFQMQSKK